MPPLAGVSRREWAPAALLAGVVLLLYLPVARFGFAGIDDYSYVRDNPVVSQGLSWQGLKWSLASTGYSANWHPLTWLSHMADVTAFGMKPGAMHLVNAVLHALNSLLLWIVLRRATGARWRSGLVAALFALHPLHVESVAWIAERKDVLSGLFWILSLAAYLGYARKPGRARYLALALLCALGLSVKPMLVSLPLALLLLDYWPLGRTLHGGRWGPLLLEKAPLAALAAGSSALTLVAQQHAQALRPLTVFSLAVRFENALVAYASYLWKTLLPQGLAVFYPHPGAQLALWKSGCSALALVALSAAVFFLRRKRPALVTGWLWYLGTLVPVIGLVQVGSQAMADRYTYLPLIGVFLAAAWGFFGSTPPAPRIAAVLAAAWCAGLGVVSSVQIGYWKDPGTLYAHAIEVTERNWLAHYNLGVEQTSRGRLNEAAGHFEIALSFARDLTGAKNNLGKIYEEQGRLADTLRLYSEAAREQPDQSIVHYNLGVVLFRLQRLPESAESFHRALRITPAWPEAHYNLGVTLFYLGKPNESTAEYREAIRLRPEYAEAHFNLANNLRFQGLIPEAAAEYQETLRLRGDFPGAREILSQLPYSR